MQVNGNVHHKTATEGQRDSGDTRAELGAGSRHSLSPNAVVRQCLDLLRAPLRKFVAERLHRAYGDLWIGHALGALHTSPGLSHIRREDLDHDLTALLQIVAKLYHAVFRSDSARFARPYFDEAREFRNALAHGVAFSLPDAFRAVDTIHRLLGVIGAEDLHSTELARERLLMHWAGGAFRRRRAAGDGIATQRNGSLPVQGAAR
jgi:hypothetical protein